MEKLTKTQTEIIGLYILVLIIFVLLGLLSSRKERGLGSLIGLNIGITIISGLWLWKGQKAWNNNLLKTKAPSK